MSRPKRAKDRRWFWGKLPADAVRLAAAPLGAAVAGLGPILLPGATVARVMLVVLGFALAAVGIIVTLKNDAFLDREHASEVASLSEAHANGKLQGRDQLASAMRESISALSRAIKEKVAGASTSHFVDQCAMAALELMKEFDPDVSVCIYKLDRREDDETPSDDWSLRRVGERHGGFFPAREEFRYDSEEGAFAIDRLRRGQTLRYPDLREEAPPGHDAQRPYAGFLSVPVNFNSSLRGMMSVDVQVPGILSKQHERSLMMIASFVGIGLTMINDRAEPQRPARAAVLRAIEEEGASDA
ncbi:GAF domain-containing protein [Brachybacterium paraconglomeratum]